MNNCTECNQILDGYSCCMNERCGRFRKFAAPPYTSSAGNVVYPQGGGGARLGDKEEEETNQMPEMKEVKKLFDDFSEGMNKLFK